MLESDASDLAVLTRGAATLGFELTPEQLERFGRYAAELLDWNTRMNLTAIEERSEVERRHFLDSLTVAAALPRKVVTHRAEVSLLDVGAGAGFPGVPLAIVLSDLRVSLLEATQKKCRFLEHARLVLDLPNVSVTCGRAEELAHTPAHRERYDVVTARAVAPLTTLAELCLPFVRIGGRFVAMKKTGIDPEIDAASYAIRTLGGRVKELIPVHVPEIGEQRLLVVVEKLTRTPRGYPRRAGVPAKSPLMPRAP
jgi:16S rRNA (guanine527-N7)-methyltransferase